VAYFSYFTLASVVSFNDVTLQPFPALNELGFLRRFLFRTMTVAGRFVLLLLTIPVKALFKDMDSKHGFATVVKVFFFVFFCHGHLILLIPTLFAL